ncbi:unnamed protein product [Durusdinium trenchii]|uniref:RING-type E3 ubiquitin transferase n=2 Tax=Durusdinium trenchii TaxID=1381693 RepID=A0ABP0MSF0_9DINO
MSVEGEWMTVRIERRWSEDSDGMEVERRPGELGDDSLDDGCDRCARRCAFVFFFLLALTEVTLLIPTVHFELDSGSMAVPIVLRCLLTPFRVLPAIDRLVRYLQALCMCWCRCSCRSSLRYQSIWNWRLALTLSVICDSAYLATSGLTAKSENFVITMVVICNMALFVVDALFIMHLAFCYVPPPSEEQENEFLAAMASVHYEERKVFRPKHIKLGATEEGDRTCSICLCEIEQEDDAARLPCGHTFHTSCIREWLHRSTYCPLRCPDMVLPPKGKRLGEAPGFASVLPGEVVQPEEV